MEIYHRLLRRGIHFASTCTMSATVAGRNHAGFGGGLSSHPILPASRSSTPGCPNEVRPSEFNPKSKNDRSHCRGCSEGVPCSKSFGPDCTTARASPNVNMPFGRCLQPAHEMQVVWCASSHGGMWSTVIENPLIVPQRLCMKH
jgi:hypothetical protein